MNATSRDAIAKRAFEIWQQEGCPSGRQLDHWLRAERELGAGGRNRPADPPRLAAAEAPRPPRITDRPQKKRR